MPQNSRPLLVRTAVTITVEPTPADSNLIETADDALELIAAVGQPNVKAMFDTFHAFYRNEVSADYVRILGDALAHVHCADIGRSPPSPGPIDRFGLMAELRNRSYQGFLAMEIDFTSGGVNPDDHARRALGFLRDIEEQLR